MLTPYSALIICFVFLVGALVLMYVVSNIRDKKKEEEKTVSDIASMLTIIEERLKYFQNMKKPFSFPIEFNEKVIIFGLSIRITVSENERRAHVIWDEGWGCWNGNQRERLASALREKGFITTEERIRTVFRDSGIQSPTYWPDGSLRSGRRGIRPP